MCPKKKKIHPKVFLLHLLVSGIHKLIACPKSLENKSLRYTHTHTYIENCVLICPSINSGDYLGIKDKPHTFSWKLFHVEKIQPFQNPFCRV